MAEGTRKQACRQLQFTVAPRAAARASGVSSPLVQSVNYVQEIGHERGARLHALRQHARTRDRAEAPGDARGSRGRAGALERHGRDRLRAARAAPPRRSPALELVDLRRHAQAVHGGLRRDGHRGLVRESARAARLAKGAPQEHARDLPRVAGESDVPRDRAEFAAESRPFRGNRARRRFHVREPDQLPSDRARRGRRDPLGHEVPERTSRHSRRRRLRQRAVHRRGAAEDDGLGPGARSVCVLAARARSQDARRAREAAERERDARRRVVLEAVRRSRRSTIPGFRITPTTRSRRRSSTDSAECSRSS